MNFFFNFSFSTSFFNMYRRLYNVIYADRGNTKTRLIIIVILGEGEERQTLFMRTRKGVAEKL